MVLASDSSGPQLQIAKPRPFVSPTPLAAPLSRYQYCALTTLPNASVGSLPPWIHASKSNVKRPATRRPAA